MDLSSCIYPTLDPIRLFTALAPSPAHHLSPHHSAISSASSPAGRTSCFFGAPLTIAAQHRQKKAAPWLFCRRKINGERGTFTYRTTAPTTCHHLCCLGVAQRRRAGDLCNRKRHHATSARIARIKAEAGIAFAALPSAIRLPPRFFRLGAQLGIRDGSRCLFHARNGGGIRGRDSRGKTRHTRSTLPHRTPHRAQLR